MDRASKCIVICNKDTLTRARVYFQQLGNWDRELGQSLRPAPTTSHVCVCVCRKRDYEFMLTFSLNLELQRVSPQALPAYPLPSLLCSESGPQGPHRWRVIAHLLPATFSQRRLRARNCDLPGSLLLRSVPWYGGALVCLLNQSSPPGCLDSFLFKGDLMRELEK